MTFVKVPKLALTLTTVLTLMLVAPSLTFGFKRTGLGVGFGTGWVDAAAPGCCELDPAGSEGVPAHAASAVASNTAPALPYSLRIALVGINTPHARSLDLTVSNTLDVPSE
ncbi:MAG TPA: hypothetical protein VFT17_10255 [Propionibacteriaceae bacterium]|nr:hypothetical protein [Propionibacteriaceae bacterium]